MRVSVVVPVHNGAATVEALVRGVIFHVDGLAEELEIVLVDDASSDGSWAVIVALADDLPSVRGIRLGRNVGEAAAVAHGMCSARYELVVTIDDDLQQPPASAPDLLRAVVGGADLVYGTPRRDQQPAARRRAAQATKWVLERGLGLPHARSISSFRAVRPTPAALAELGCSPGMAVDPVLLRHARVVAAVPVAHEPRRAGTSGYTFVPLARHAWSLAVASPRLRRWRPAAPAPAPIHVVDQTG